MGESVSTTTRSASFPGSRDPVSGSRPKAPAPHMVAIETMSFAGNALLSPVSFLWKFAQNLICVNKSKVLPLAGPSVPSPTVIPCSSMELTGATPLAAFVLEPMQWATLLPDFAIRLISCSVRRMLCAHRVWLSRIPSRSRYSMGVHPYCSFRYVIS